MLESRKFQRNKEDFVCEHCGTKVIGTGYTNHCPNCLWGKHVDINPGDRAADCLGMMKPIGLLIGKEWRIVHRCQKCGKTIKNRTSANDNSDELVLLSKKVVPNIS